MKLVTEIKRWVDKEVVELFPDVEILDSREMNKGFFYKFCLNGSHFCLFIQDLKDFPKVHWFFHNDFCEDEVSYWKGKYNFKLIGSDIKYIKTFLQFDNSVDNEIKVAMDRRVSTLRIFRKDFKWIIVMIRVGGAK